MWDTLDCRSPGLADRPEDTKAGGTKGEIKIRGLGDTKVYFIYLIIWFTAHIKRHNIR